MGCFDALGHIYLVVVNGLFMVSILDLLLFYEIDFYYLFVIPM